MKKKEKKTLREGVWTEIRKFKEKNSKKGENLRRRRRRRKKERRLLGQEST